MSMPGRSFTVAKCMPLNASSCCCSEDLLLLLLASSPREFAPWLLSLPMSATVYTPPSARERPTTNLQPPLEAVCSTCAGNMMFSAAVCTLLKSDPPHRTNLCKATN